MNESEGAKPARARLRPRKVAPGGVDRVYDLLADDPEAIEDGLRLVERGLAVSPSRRLELLLAAPTGRVVAVVAAVEPRDDLALDALDAARAIRRASPLLARVFPALRFDLPPRLLVLAPRFTSRAIARFAGFPDGRVEAFAYTCVEVGGERALLVERCSPERRGRSAASPPAAPPPARANAPSPSVDEPRKEREREKLAPVLEELRSRARERILRLSDAVVSEPIADDGERFRLGDQVIAEVRVAGENALEVGSGESGLGATREPQPVFNNTELEDALSPVIRRFFALYRQKGAASPASSAAPAPSLAPAPPPLDLRPAALTREEIDEFYKDSEN